MENLALCTFLKLNIFLCLRDIFQVSTTLFQISQHREPSSPCERGDTLFYYFPIFTLA